MQATIKFNETELLEKLTGLNHAEFMAAWSTVILQYAQKQAREKIGGNFGDRIARQSIHVNDNNPDLHIVHIAGENGYIAEHIHTGGPIKPRYRKYLAIPIDKTAKGKYPSEWAQKLIVLRKKEDGLRGRAYLALQMQKKIKVLYVLKNKVEQKPRPWWPSDAEVRHVSLQFFQENFLGG